MASCLAGLLMFGIAMMTTGIAADRDPQPLPPLYQHLVLNKGAPQRRGELTATTGTRFIRFIFAPAWQTHFLPLCS